MSAQVTEEHADRAYADTMAKADGIMADRPVSKALAVVESGAHLLAAAYAEIERLTTQRDNARFAAENYRKRYMSANDDPTCPALSWVSDGES